MWAQLNVRLITPLNNCTRTDCLNKWNDVSANSKRRSCSSRFVRCLCTLIRQKDVDYIFSTYMLCRVMRGSACLCPVG